MYLTPVILNKVLVNFFRNFYTRIKTKGWEYASNSLAFSAFLYAILGDGELREMLYGMIQSTDDLFAWVGYIGEYTSLPAMSAEQENLWIDFFISTAYAARDADTYLAAMRRMLNEALSNGAATDANQVGELLTQTIVYVKRHADDINFEKMQFEPDFFKASFKAWQSVGEDGIKAVIQASKGLREHTVGYKEFVGEMSLIIDDAGALFAREASDASQGVGKFLKREMGSKIDNVQYKVTGAVHHIHSVANAIRNRSGHLISMEFPVDITVTVNGVVRKLGRREYDAVIRIDGADVHIDAKSWLPEDTISRLKASIKGEGLETGKKGQLLKDIVEIYNKKDIPDFKIEWHFDKRSRGEENTYLEAIKDELEGSAGENIRGILGIVDEVEWEEALRVIFNKLDDGFIKVID